MAGLLLVVIASGQARAQEILTEAFSREFVVQVGGVPDYPQAISRELTFFVGEDPLRPYREALSREISLVDATNAVPASIMGLTIRVTATGNAVILDWSNYPELTQRDVDRYQIYRSDLPFANISSMTPVVTVRAGTFTYTFEGLTPFQDQYFAVVAVDALNNFNQAASAVAVAVGAPPVAASIAGIDIPPLLPPGASAIEARALAEQPGLGVLVALSGTYAGRGNGNGNSAKTTNDPKTAAAVSNIEPDYTNPQPYTLSQVVRVLNNGKPDSTFTNGPGGDGTVNALAVQVDQKILVGGSFTTFNGGTFRNIARLKSDGTADTTFATGSGTDAQVNAVAVQADGKILIGGTFQNYGGLPWPYLARLNPDGKVDPTFVPALNGAVNTLAIQSDGRIVAGGNFTRAGTMSRTRMARLLATGVVDASFDPGAGANDEVVSLLVQNNGSIVAAGDFTSFAGQSRGRIVRLLSTGALDPAFLATAMANNTILSLGLQSDGKILLGGSFSQVNNVARAHLARLQTDGSLDTDFDPGAGANGDIRALLVRSDGTVFIAGLFNQYQASSVNEVAVILGTAIATTVTHPPQSVDTTIGSTARFVAEATGVGVLTYQWSKDGVAIPSATSSNLTLTNVTPDAQGTYTIQITSSTGNTTSSNAKLTVASTGVSSIANLSGRADSGSGDNALFVGFVISGIDSKQILLRAAGPALATLFGVPGVMPNPRLRLFKGAEQIGSNLDWDPILAPTMSRLGAFSFPTGSRDAALLVPLPPGGYSAIVDDENGGTGVVLAEVYDADVNPLASNVRLDNLSMRTYVGSGAKVLIPGVVVSGNVPRMLLFRGIGPRLIDFGLPAESVLADPIITLISAADNSIAGQNDDWSLAPNAPEIRLVSAQVGAFSLLPGSKDAALLVSLPPGQYSLICAGKNGSEGVALVEVYFVP